MHVLAQTHAVGEAAPLFAVVVPQPSRPAWPRGNRYHTHSLRPLNVSHLVSLNQHNFTQTHDANSRVAFRRIDPFAWDLRLNVFDSLKELLPDSHVCASVSYDDSELSLIHI